MEEELHAEEVEDVDRNNNSQHEKNHNKQQQQQTNPLNLKIQKNPITSSHLSIVSMPFDSDTARKIENTFNVLPNYCKNKKTKNKMII